MTTPPQIAGYRFDEQLLDHPMAEIWRGRTTTGMEVLVLRLTETGAADPEVRQRLERASRTAAPLWAGNFAATRPYAVTQLLPDRAGVERFLDPLDGIIGNDSEAVERVRERLLATTSYAAEPATGSFPGRTVPGEDGNRQSGVPEEAGPFDRWFARQGWRAHAVVIVMVLVAFTAFYSAGAVIRSAGDDPQPLQPKVPRPEAVSPSAMPTGVVLPAVRKAIGAKYDPNLKPVRVIGAIYTSADKTELVQDIGLPVVFRWPEKYTLLATAESATEIDRVVASADGKNPFVAAILAHPCPDKIRCLAERRAFEQRRSARSRSATPATAVDDTTWYAVGPAEPGLYRVSMTRVFRSNGVWWLLGADVAAPKAQESAAQKVLNDIRTQTP